MSKKGKDKDLDHFLEEIDCKNRKNASAAWRVFKAANGVVAPSSFFNDEGQILDEYR